MDTAPSLQHAQHESMRQQGLLGSPYLEAPPGFTTVPGRLPDQVASTVAPPVIAAVPGPVRRVWSPRKFPYLSASPLRRAATATYNGVTRTYAPGDYLIILRDGTIIYRTRQEFDWWFNRGKPLPPPPTARPRPAPQPPPSDLGAGI